MEKRSSLLLENVSVLGNALQPMANIHITLTHGIQNKAGKHICTSRKQYLRNIRRRGEEGMMIRLRNDASKIFMAIFGEASIFGRISTGAFREIRGLFKSS